MGKKNILRSGFFNADRVTLLTVTAVFAVMAVLVYTGNVGRQIQNMLTSVACYIVLAVSLNLVVGLLGELSLGHAGFMSVGLFTGCTVAVLLQGKLPAAVCLPLCMVIGGLAAALVGLVVGLPALRLGGDYLAIVTLGCGEIIKNVLTNLNIKGTPLQGALGIDTSSIRRNSKDLLPYAILLVLLTMLVIMNFKRSKHGRAIMAIRDNRIAAESVGINITKYKLMRRSLPGRQACCTATACRSCRRILSGTICPLKYLSSWCWAAWATSAARFWQPSFCVPCRRRCATSRITGCSPTRCCLSPSCC